MESGPFYLKPIVHNNYRRALWHDYRSRCIYMVTIRKHSSLPAFGEIVNKERPREASVRLSIVGKILEEEILVTPLHNREIKIIRYSVMPDHVHVLLFVTEMMNKPLGDVIQALKSSVTSRLRKELKDSYIVAFEPGFHDRILLRRNQLETLIAYIRDNPYRLAVRLKYPYYFNRINNVIIDGKSYNAYGNMFLLKNPFKEQVIVHRRDSENTYACKCAKWLYAAANGGVLVSPFISVAEKIIRAKAESIGGRFIYIRNEPFPPERYKPSGHDFSLCTGGRLLIVAPASAVANCHDGSGLTRSACVAMNNLASLIAANNNY